MTTITPMNPALTARSTVQFGKNRVQTLGLSAPLLNETSHQPDAGRRSFLQTGAMALGALSLNSLLGQSQVARAQSVSIGTPPIPYGPYVSNWINGIDVNKIETHTPRLQENYEQPINASQMISELHRGATQHIYDEAGELTADFKNVQTLPDGVYRFKDVLKFYKLDEMKSGNGISIKDMADAAGLNLNSPIVVNRNQEGNLSQEDQVQSFLRRNGFPEYGTFSLNIKNSAEQRYIPAALFKAALEQYILQNPTPPANDNSMNQYDWAVNTGLRLLGHNLQLPTLFKDKNGQSKEIALATSNMALFGTILSPHMTDNTRLLRNPQVFTEVLDNLHWTIQCAKEGNGNLNGVETIKKLYWRIQNELLKTDDPHEPHVKDLAKQFFDAEFNNLAYQGATPISAEMLRNGNGTVTNKLSTEGQRKLAAVAGLSLADSYRLQLWSHAFAAPSGGILNGTPITGFVPTSLKDGVTQSETWNTITKWINVLVDAAFDWDGAKNLNPGDAGFIDRQLAKTDYTFNEFLKQQKGLLNNPQGQWQDPISKLYGPNNIRIETSNRGAMQILHDVAVALPINTYEVHNLYPQPIEGYTPPERTLGSRRQSIRRDAQGRTLTNP